MIGAPDDCVFYPASTESPCGGEVEEEWVDDGYGDCVAQYRCRVHSYYRQTDRMCICARCAKYEGCPNSRPAVDTPGYEGICQDCNTNNRHAGYDGSPDKSR